MVFRAVSMHFLFSCASVFYFRNRLPCVHRRFDVARLPFCISLRLFSRATRHFIERHLFLTSRVHFIFEREIPMG